MKRNKFIATIMIIIMALSLNIGTVFATKGDRSTPYSASTKQRFNFQKYDEAPKVVEMQLDSIMKGEAANTKVYSENPYNKEPESDEEWILMEFTLKYVSGPEEELNATDVIYSYGSFYTNSGQKISPRDTAVFSYDYSGYGEYDVELYPGGESKVYYGILVNKSVGYPLIRIATDFNEATYDTKYIWFSTDPNYTPTISVSGISLSENSMTLEVGDSDTIIPIVTPNDAVNQSVTWKSSNESIATVDATGKVTAVGNGSATITATTIEGNKTASCSVWIGDLVTPVSPGAISLNYNSAKIFWEPVSHASGYQIYRSSEETGTYRWVKSTASTSYTNTGLETGDTYFYKVRAFRHVGTERVFSDFSTIVSANPTLFKPTSLKAATASYNSAKISWKPVSGAVGYQIYRSTSKTGTYRWVKSTASTSFTNTGLMTGKTYYYKVRAYRYEDTRVYGDYTAAVSVKPIPSTPTNFKVSRLSSTSTKSSWSKVSGATYYQVYRATQKTGTYKYVKTTSATSYKNYSLTKGRTYYYKVRAYKIVGKTKVFGNYTSIKPVKL